MAPKCVPEHCHEDDDDPSCSEPGGGGGGGGGGGEAGSGGVGGDAGSGGSAGTGGDAGSAGAGGESGGGGLGGDAGSAGTGGEPAAGTGGTGGEPSGGTGGVAGLGGQAGAGGAAGTGGTSTVPCSSLECGDGCRDPATEECDDGNYQSGDSCNPICGVSDALVGSGAIWSPGEPAPPGYSLSNSRHPISGASDGFAVVLSATDGADSRVMLRTYDSAGVPGALLEASVNAWPLASTSAALAALDDGSFATVWEDFGVDDDELGVALRLVTPATTPAEAPIAANSAALGAQYEPDIVRVGNELVVAWRDDSDWATAPDIRYRRFTQSLLPLSSESTLVATDAIESGVSLLDVGGALVAGWREGSGGKETVVVRWNYADYRVAPRYLPPGADERPALLALDDDQLLLAYTDAREDGSTRLRVAVLSASEPGDVAAVTVSAKADGVRGVGLDQSRPSLVRAGGQLFLAWATDRVVGDARAKDVWLKELFWDGTAEELDLSSVEIVLPRQPEHLVGDQGAPALSSMPYSNGVALVSAWDDFGRTFGAASGWPDVVAEVIPLPLLREASLSEMGE